MIPPGSEKTGVIAAFEFSRIAILGGARRINTTAGRAPSHRRARMPVSLEPAATLLSYEVPASVLGHTYRASADVGMSVESEPRNTPSYWPRARLRNCLAPVLKVFHFWHREVS
ncbi:hypothetical protein Bbelb_172430 [Branchiostoma belcheri]|nr:hypothetical protein Bbelb_172430 [Branchiostoma belcheri]